MMSRQYVAGSIGIRWRPTKEWYGWSWPNPHQWLLYQTVGKFFIWLKWDGWRPFCDWTGGYRRTYPLIARILHKIGKTMSYSFHGGECYHCAWDDGDPGVLSESDEHFKVIETGTSSTPDGTDHWFRGIATCPRCGYESEYGDGSL
jgi:hypothetical protein